MDNQLQNPKTEYLSFDNKRRSNRDLNKKRQGFTLPDSKYIREDQDFEPEISPSFSDVLSNSRSPAYDQGSDQVMIKYTPKINLWVQGGLRIMFYITKFARQLKNHSTQINFKFLNKQMVDLISDFASDSDELLQKMTTSHKIIQNVLWALNEIPTIDPDSTFKLFWDIFVLVQIVINIFYIPMKLGFGFENEGAISSAFFNTIPSWTFVVDIMLNFLTAYYYKGQIHRDKKEILQNYTRIYFWWDLMIVVPYILSSFNVQYTEYILLLRVTKVKSMIESLEEIINPSENIQAVLSLVKSIFFIMFVCHFCACLWTLIGELEHQNNQMSWLKEKHIENEDWSTKYIHSLYFSTITTLTVGYGDIVPTTDIERLYVILMALVICGVLGYTISSIGDILRQLSEKEQIYKQRMRFINNYLKKKELNKQLQLQVRKYFEYSFKMELESNELGEEMMNKLPKYLKEQVAIDIYFAMLMKSRLIYKTLSKSSVYRLCSFVHERKFTPEEIVVSQDETADKLYFIQKGEASLICDNNLRETKLATVSAGKYIGEREFIIQTRYDYTVKTTNFTQMAYINYDDFLRVIREDALEEEHFCMMRDALQFNDDQKNFGQVCYICQWTHQFKNCPLVFLNVNRDKMKSRFTQSENQTRKIYSDRIPKKRHINILNMREEAVAIMVHNNYVQTNELEDTFLRKLGFKTDDDNYTKTLRSISTFKHSQSNSGFRELQNQNSDQQSDSVHSEEEDEIKDSAMFGASPRRKAIFQKKISMKESLMQRKVKFQEEPDARNLRSQNAVQTRIFNRKQSQKFSILQNTKLSSFNNFNAQMESSQKLSSTEMDLLNFSKSRTETVNMMVQLQEEMALNHITDLTHERVDFDIDKQFLATFYFKKANFDIVVAKFDNSRNSVKPRTKIPIFSLLKKKS